MKTSVLTRVVQFYSHMSPPISRKENWGLAKFETPAPETTTAIYSQEKREKNQTYLAVLTLLNGCPGKKTATNNSDVENTKEQEKNHLFHTHSCGFRTKKIGNPHNSRKEKL